ncbi:hypothetical protein N9E48_10770 [Paracoccaceae bacterium]|nr:hypothetical protein [Paracoccaceae bacterium]
MPLLSLSGVNYCAHRFRLCEQSDASYHLFDSTAQLDNLLLCPDGKPNPLATLQEALHVQKLIEVIVTLKVYNQFKC